jgi:hypothetical protein
VRTFALDCPSNLSGFLGGVTLASPERRVDVLIATHHRSHRIDVTALATWRRYRLAVSCQGPLRRAGRAPGLYKETWAVLQATHDHGAVELRVNADRLTAWTFVTGERWRAEDRQSEQVDEDE